MGRGRAAHHVLEAAHRRPPRRTGRRTPYRWTDEALEAALRRFVAGRREFPTFSEFDAAGRTDLRSAVSELGGIEFWANRIGLPVPPGRRPAAYDTAAAVRDARAAMGEAGGRLPGEARLRRMGYPRLATRVRQAGGAARFAAAHNLYRK